MDPQMANQTGESRDGTGAGDHDIAFVWGAPRQYLTVRCQARLTVLRGRVMDFNHGEPGGPADGDTDYVHVTSAGLYVTAPTHPMAPKDDPT